MSDKENNNLQPSNEPINWKSLGFFSVQDYLIYIFKKTEKITAALYLVSGLLKDDDPMKWELRDRGMDLLNSSFTASSPLPGDKNSFIQALFTAALETISILNVAKISNLVSEMNHSILVHEIDQVLGLLRDRLTANAENAGFVLSEQFFKTPELFSSGFKTGEKVFGKGHSETDTGFSQPAVGQYPRNKGGKQEQGHVLEKKNKRQENILAILKGQGNLTIKDFSKVIKDCSEKTIQRELLELVDKGVIRKEGERRWSRYSLKS